MSSPLRSKKRGSTVVWALMALLVLGLGGFGAANFGGSVRSIGSVGDQDIDVNDYDRALKRELAAASAQVGEQLSFAQAQTLGLDQAVQAQLLATSALDGESARIGLSVGDAEVRRQLMAIPAFHDASGKFDRDTYALMLKQEGFGQAEFEGKLRKDGARMLLQGAVLGGSTAPAAYVDHIASWATETRDFTVAELLPSDLSAPVPAPTEDEIKAYYDAHPADFTRPEIRKITYAWLSPDMLKDKVDLDEAALKASYQEHISDYVIPERRLVERLVFPDEAAAKDARARLDAGTVTFEGLAEERGLTLADADMGDVSKKELGAAGDAVFALTEPGIVGPLQTDLGPTLFSMNGILAASETSFEDAREDLAAEAATDKARRMIADESDAIEDLLASGATLEEAAKEKGLELGTIDFSAETQDGIAAYTAFREAAIAAKTDDFPTLVPLDDGGVFALRLDAIEPPALRPLDEVREAVTAGATREATHKALLALGEEIKAGLDNGTDLSSTGLVTTRYENFARGGFMADVPADVAAQGFRLAEHGSAVVDSDGRVLIISVSGIHAADPASEDLAKARAAIAEQAGQSIGQDMFRLFAEAIEGRAGIRLDQAAINAVNAQMN